MTRPPVDPVSALATANFWIEISTALVIFGVVLEFVDLLSFNKEMSRRQKVLLLVATVFVVVGCAGEFLFEHDAAEAESQLQRQSDETVARLEAAEAGDKSTIARDEAKLAAANLEMVRLGKDEARLTLAANGAQLETIRIKQSLTWRELTPTQVRKVIKALAEAPMKVGVMTYGDDSEQSLFAEQLRNVFAKAGLDLPRGASLAIGIGAAKEGVELHGTAHDVARMKAALTLGGVTGIKTEIDDQATRLTVAVGVHPRARLD